MATPVPPSANTVAVASKAACLGRNTCDLLSVVVFLKWNSWPLRTAEDGSKKSVRLLQGARGGRTSRLRGTRDVDKPIRRSCSTGGTPARRRLRSPRGLHER